MHAWSRHVSYRFVFIVEGGVAEITVALLEHAGKVLDEHYSLYVLGYLYYTGEGGVQRNFTRAFPLLKVGVYSFETLHYSTSVGL